MKYKFTLWIEKEDQRPEKEEYLSILSLSNRIYDILMADPLARVQTVTQVISESEQESTKST